MPIIRRNNCIYATLGICHSGWMTSTQVRRLHPAYQTVIHTQWQIPSVAQIRFHSTLHTRQSSTQSDKYQVSHRYSYFSWWWAHSRTKLVEKRNKHTKKNCTPSWLYLQDGIVCLHSIFKDCLPVLLVDARNRRAPNIFFGFTWTYNCRRNPNIIAMD